DDEKSRLWYAEQTIRNGWSQPTLCLQIDGRVHERHGKALTNFKRLGDVRAERALSGFENSHDS
ncbi:MAG: DUF1016 domain-containing protein, partial [Deltaproteobacteria bacterium]|nr:DUF1016 domain-containing protein [Deltaproteobacteria bacterium]